MKHFLTLLAAPLIGACCTPGTSMTDTPPDGLCAFTATETSAWKDRMPGPDGANGNLVVVVELEDDGISRRFTSQGVGEDGTLTLDVTEWDQEAGLGKIVFRNKGLEAERVEIRCGGEVIQTLDVKTVY